VDDHHRSLTPPEGSMSGRGSAPGRGRPGQGRKQTFLQLMTQLQPRDKVIAHLLAEHRTLTTQQITAVLFPSHDACRQRLYRLRRRGFIDCFTLTGTAQPGHPGHAGHPGHPGHPGHVGRTHWVSGPVSALYVAYCRREPAPTARALQERQGRLAASAHLHHLDGVNQFFIDLITQSRARPETRLLRWWSTARTASALGRRVYPDGHGVWRDSRRDPHSDPRSGRDQVGFFLEYDTGTEPISVLLEKVRSYRALHRDGGPDYPVLFWLPTAAREAHLHEKLKTVRRNGLTIATASRAATIASGQSPADAVWQLVRNGRSRNGRDRNGPGRLPLVDLPSTPGQPGPYHPGPPRADDDPLHLLHDPTG
jgi:hypothetical protein